MSHDEITKYLKSSRYKWVNELTDLIFYNFFNHFKIVPTTFKKTPKII